jgi:hypothetical protein
LRIKWRHSSGRFSLAAFAPWRLGENRRLNKEAHFSPRRKSAKAVEFFSHKTFILAGRICRSVKNVKQIGCSGIPKIFINSQVWTGRESPFRA